MARYEAGETLSSIARTYDCSPPAISYVISRSRARQPDGETAHPPASASEPQLIKAATGDGSPGVAGRPPPATAPDAPAAADGMVVLPHGEPAPAQPQPQPTALAVDSQGDRRIEIRPRESNGFARPIGGEREPLHSASFMRPAPAPAPRPAVPNQPTGPANGDQRGRLHLSLGNGSPANNASPALDSRPPERPYNQGAPQAPLHAAGERGPWSPAPPQQRNPGPADQTRYGPAPNGSPGRGDGESAQRKESSGSYIDQELRARVEGDIAAFLAAFDAALLEDTQESRAALREATDRMLRAGARTRIELERLEARLPLPPRDASRQSDTAWRQRY